MKRILQIISVLFIFSMLLDACTSNEQKNQEQAAARAADSLKVKARKDSLESCTKTIMDPNNPKPMALMMRLMAANADSMNKELKRGESIDSTLYPFIPFYLVEPTDPKVLEPQFFENARLFKMAYLELFKHPKAQVKYYNLMINSCIHCHETYCSGPLKRIRNFPITE